MGNCICNSKSKHVAINLIVIKTHKDKIDKLKDFYTKLGLDFVLHKHGAGPLHWSTMTHDNICFEIYPLDKNQSVTTFDDVSVLGLRVPSKLFNSVVKELNGTTPVETRYGIVSVVRDPDNRRVELTKD